MAAEELRQAGAFVLQQPVGCLGRRAGAVAALPPGMLYGIVSNGFGRMPPYAPELRPSDRWAIVAYILTLRGLPPADSAERNDSARAAELRPLDPLRSGARQ